MNTSLTERQLRAWLDACPEDYDLEATAQFIRECASTLETGTPPDQVLRSIYRRYYQSTEEAISDDARTVLIQSTEWLAVDSDMDIDDAIRVYEEEFRRGSDFNSLMSQIKTGHRDTAGNPVVFISPVEGPITLVEPIEPDYLADLLSDSPYPVET